LHIQLSNTMNKGKRTCEVLKEVRRTIARENNIPLKEHECTFEGECSGTCPYCEAEMRHLERELERRRNLGKAVTVAGIAMSTLVMGACNSPTPTNPGEPELPTQTIQPQDTVSSVDSSENVNNEEANNFDRSISLDGVLEKPDTVLTDGEEDEYYDDYIVGIIIEDEDSEDDVNNIDTNFKHSEE